MEIFEYYVKKFAGYMLNSNMFLKLNEFFKNKTWSLNDYLSYNEFRIIHLFQQD